MRRTFILAFLSASVAVLALAGLARAASPAWTVSSNHFPTNVQPATTIYYSVVASNVGTATSTAGATATVTLPSDMTANTATGIGWTCPAPAGQNVITCTNLLPVVAGQTSNPISITATVPAGASGTLGSTVSLTGGGFAETATSTDAAQVAAPAGFGIAGFTARAYDDTGHDVTGAGAHPWMATTQISLNTVAASGGAVGAVNVEDARTLSVDLPPGFLGNPKAAPRCPLALFTIGGTLNNCPADTVVGRVALLTANAGSAPGSALAATTTAAVYNLVPEHGHAGEFGFIVSGAPQIIYAGVRNDGNYRLSIDASKVPVLAGQAVIMFTIYGEPGAFAGTGSTAPFLTNPTECSATQTTKLSVDSWYRPEAPPVSTSYDSPDLTGCDQLRFEPTIGVTPDSTQAGQPTGLGVHIQIPQVEEIDKPGTPPLRNSVVTLPQGLSINPSLAENLQGCTDAQYGEHDGEPGRCPEASRIGTVEVTSPLVDHKLPGSLYIRQPEAGQTRADGLYTLFLEVNDPESGVIVKLRGSVVPDEATGQLTATFKDNPQLPFSDLDLRFKGGPNGALINSGACGPQTTQAQFTPWAGSSSAPVSTTSTFTTEGCGPGGFKPGFEAGSSDTGAAHYSPFTLRVTRGDGEENVSRIDAVLPVGLTAKLAGVPLCGEAEAASGNCSSSSQIGTTTVGVGAGQNLLYVPQPGKAPTGVYLAGPYKGDPYSLVVKVPAQAGPFDLGTVAVRSAIHVDPETAQVSVHSDPLPQILEGVPISYRDIRVVVNRSDFTLNPTNCNQMSVRGQVSSASGTAADVASPFKVGGCEALAFAPKLALHLKGQTKRTGHPALNATVTYPQGGGYANIARAQVNLPHGEFLDQGNLNKTCTKPVLLEGKCPESSIYGYAKAWTPLLDKPLEGAVYLVGGYGYKLPALVAELNGQIKVLLVGKVDSGPNKGIRNTFEVVPDAPVEKFELRMKGGSKYGLLENSEALCKASKAKRKANAYFNAQNGKVLQTKPLVANECAKHKKSTKK